MVVQVAMEMSLDEWKALQEMSRPKAEFNIRKAEDKIPSKATVIHKSKHVEVRSKCSLIPKGSLVLTLKCYQLMTQVLLRCENLSDE